MLFYNSIHAGDIIAKILPAICHNMVPTSEAQALLCFSTEQNIQKSFIYMLDTYVIF